MLLRLAGASIGLAIAFAAMPAHAALGLSLFDSGFSAPVFLTGRGTQLYVVEQDGTIVSVNRTTKARSTFFTVPNVATGGEKGLLGFAFDPGYSANGRFYVNVTARVNGQLVSEVRRYSNPAIRTEAPSVILRVDQPFDNHKAGWLGFGRDGFLYAALGDGGSGNDPLNNAQNPASLLGKMLRLNVKTDAYPADPNRNYAIPRTNPFGNEILASGLRNPFRNSIDATTGDLWIGDVGQNAFEEVNRIPGGTSGQNFGWRPLEGTAPTPGVGDPIPPGTTAPVLVYNRSVGRSITGGYVYRGSGIPELFGRYVFGDFVTGRLFSVALDGSDLRDISALAAALGGGNWSSFGEDATRKLYVIDYGGRILSFGNTPAAAAAIARLAAPSISSAPEPQAWALLIAGFGLVGAAQRRRRMLPATAGA